MFRRLNPAARISPSGEILLQIKQILWSDPNVSQSQKLAFRDLGIPFFKLDLLKLPDS